MLKIIIQNPASETIINNVYPDELAFWKELLEGSVQGVIRVVDAVSGLEYDSGLTTALDSQVA